MIKVQEQSFFLVETDTKGEMFPLQKTFNGSGFQRAYDNSSAFKFSDEEKVKQACKVQNMMNTIFGSDKVIYYCKENIQRETFSENGEVVEIEEVSEQENNQPNTNVIP